MPAAATAALLHVEGVSESARAREVYKYYQPQATATNPTQSSRVPSPFGDLLAADEIEPFPALHSPTDVTSSTKTCSPDTALTAFCQLVSWRVESQRAMISLIDGEHQYFIAESTKTLDLVDNTLHGSGDEIWIGCATVDKRGRLCEKTIAVPPSRNGEYPSFIVNDLSKDERFNQLPFVTGAPALRFYAGVPLITKRGIPIGSLFVVDSVVRDGLSRAQIEFMGTMAVTIMKHMEMTREVQEHRRGMKMSRGLASFVEGRAELVEAEVEAEDGEGTKIAGQFEIESAIGPPKSKAGSTRRSALSNAGSVASIDRKERDYSNALAKTEEKIFAAGKSVDIKPMPQPIPQPLDSPNVSNFGGISADISSPASDPIDKIATPDEEVSEGLAFKVLFSRASNLIREAFEVDGGAIFYDAQKGFSNEFPQSIPSDIRLARPDSQASSGDDLSSPGEPLIRIATSSPKVKSPLGHLPTKGEHLFPRSSEDSKPVDILGFSTPEASSIHGDPCPGPQSFIPFDETSLNVLLRRYPRGKLWTFDDDGAVSLPTDDELKYHKGRLQSAKDIHRRRSKLQRNIKDGTFLVKHFPKVRQLLFVPLWDSGRSRWLSGCCVWSTEPTRILSKQGELAFLTAFGNSVMAECSRIDTEIADQKKGDFIGSISHELRSPLHGILASAEFLSEEVESGFEKGLVETIDSCGRTLLDTINHILDFSKINHFERNWRKTRRAGPRSAPRSGSLSMSHADLPMINLFAEVDISVICEEVVEGVFAGHVFQNMTAKTFDMVPDTRAQMSDPKTNSASVQSLLEPTQNSEVAVILDVDVENYRFTTQPGAFRRVIMNLLGNALKYTSHGYVKITLEASDIEDLRTPGNSQLIPRSLVTLTVTDTGRGISSEFLRSKLFTPFAQENSLSSGTGLGLSIVRSIVALLEGDITIDSELGRGTQVKVSLPLLREMPRQPESSSSDPRSVTSMAPEPDDSIAQLRARVSGQRVSLYGFDLDPKDPIVYQMGQLLKQSVTKFLTGWFGLEIVALGQKADIIIANEASAASVAKLVRSTAKQIPNPSILVLISHSSRFDRSHSGAKGNLGYVAKPVGPLKLARALVACLDGARPVITTPGVVECPVSTDLSNIFEDLTFSSHGGGVLDNSRMAADTDNARRAVESPTPSGGMEKTHEFPFPAENKPVLAQSTSMPEMTDVSKDTSKKKTSALTLTAMGNPPASASKRAPSLLLVDDNRINLSLLRTYMRKRKYQLVDEAENGLDAVNKFEAKEGGYDIIFMDISMPVLDGFGATRQIRSLEESRRLKMREKLRAQDLRGGLDGASSSEGRAGQAKANMPALVIALTGLASSKDQNEAYTSGIDLFLTKPVALKEVGKLLDNWEANKERESLREGGLSPGLGPDAS